MKTAGTWEKSPHLLALISLRTMRDKVSVDLFTCSYALVLLRSLFHIDGEHKDGCRELSEEGGNEKRIPHKSDPDK